MDYGYGGGGGGMYTTAYGAQGGANGGGFMNTGSQGDGQGNSGNRRDYGKETLRPVTIKQLLEAQSPQPDSFLVDGSEVTQVTFVGQVRNVSTQATHHTYKLDDGTGQLEVKQYLDPEAAMLDDGDPTKPQIAGDAYARVYGRLKEFNNKRHLGCHVIRPIEDFNEVQYHLLEATAVHLHHTRGPIPSKGANGEGPGGQQQQKANGFADVNADGSGRVLPAGLSAVAKRVYNCLSSLPKTNEGYHMQELAVKLNMDMADVARAGEELINIPLIYTTVDDDTWTILDEY